MVPIISTKTAQETTIFIKNKALKWEPFGL